MGRSLAHHYRGVPLHFPGYSFLWSNPLLFTPNLWFPHRRGWAQHLIIYVWCPPPLTCFDTGFGPGNVCQMVSHCFSGRKTPPIPLMMEGASSFFLVFGDSQGSCPHDNPPLCGPPCPPLSLTSVISPLQSCVPPPKFRCPPPPFLCSRFNCRPPSPTGGFP